MRVVVDSQALEALCQAAEDKHRHLVAKLRASVRSEPKTEAITKVADYSATSDVLKVEQATAFAPRVRSAVTPISDR